MCDLNCLGTIYMIKIKGHSKEEMIKLTMKTLIWEPRISQGSPEKQIQKNIYLFVCYRSWLTEFGDQEFLWKLEFLPGESCRTKKASGMSWWCFSPKAREPRGQECECWCDSESLGTQAGEDGCLSSSREGKPAFFQLLIPLTPSLDWIMSTSIKNSLLYFVYGFKY